MSASVTMISTLTRLLQSAPRNKYFYLLVLSSPLLAVAIPTAIVLSHPLYAAALDASLVFALASYHSLAGASRHPDIPATAALLPVLSVACSVARLIAVNHVAGSTHACTINQRQLLVLWTLVTILGQCAYQWHTTGQCPLSLVIAPLLLSLLVLVSIVWVPTSHEQALESELAVLRETGLLNEVRREQTASLRYFVLDHAVHNRAIHLNHSTATGERTALVLLHGYGAGSLFFAHSMPRWSQSFNVYSVDLLGFGLSAHDPFTAKTPSEAELHFVHSLNRWRESVCIEKMIVLGHSLGGMIAAAYALHYPQHTHAVVLVSPVGIPNAPSDLNTTFRGPAAFRALRPLFQFLWGLGLSPASGLHFVGPLGPWLVRKIVETRFGRYDHIRQTPSLADYFYHINAHQGSGLSTLNSLIAPGAYARHPLGERMKQSMTAPTYFIFGQTDWMFNPVTHDVLQALNDRGVVCMLDRVSQAGHQVTLENIEEFELVVAKRLEQWLATQQH